MMNSDLLYIIYMLGKRGVTLGMTVLDALAPFCCFFQKVGTACATTGTAVPCSRLPF